ncbi:MAG TPA: DUF523 and DUF1722 domain-containing protein [Planctomycetota bacterium]|nr:DUF523 and DUF1722 domain-containing protein [Planctomycetota bacterium]
MVVSRCIEFDHCRWNGLVIASDAVKIMRPHIEFLPVCPEAEIGLGCPREPVRLVDSGDGPRMVQPATGRDCTDDMKRLAATFLDALAGGVDGFILKSRSPSCGAADAKVYARSDSRMARGKGRGLFAAAVLERFGHLPVEDEGRLRNLTIRDHFLTRVHTLARWRAVRASLRMDRLVGFQAAHKLLLLAHSETLMRRMGRLVANHSDRPAAALFAEYEGLLHQALREPARPEACINVLDHAMGYFKKRVSDAEKRFLAGEIGRYRAGRAPLSVPVGLLRAWIVRFGEEYLAGQTFFLPYPEELVSVTDSGTGRKLR